jgi:hypothetical protein
MLNCAGVGNGRKQKEQRRQGRRSTRQRSRYFAGNQPRGRHQGEKSESTSHQDPGLQPLSGRDGTPPIALRLQEQVTCAQGRDDHEHLLHE